MQLDVLLRIFVWLVEEAASRAELSFTLYNLSTCFAFVVRNIICITRSANYQDARINSIMEYITWYTIFKKMHIVFISTLKKKIINRKFKDHVT